MSSVKNILTAFLLNLFFSAAEFAGGALTGSAAIMSDAVHDLGDALSIGVSWLLERKSRKKPDELFTYGYARYSVLGGTFTSLVLLLGSVLVIYRAVTRILNPVPINYDGMLLLAVFGLIVNGAAAYFTRSGDSVNQRAVNLHMLEDVLGWAVVLAGAAVMRFTDIKIIDPLMSIAVSVYVGFEALKTLPVIAEIFLEKSPRDIEVAELKQHLAQLEGVEEVHHLHLWSMDGVNHCATLHAVSGQDAFAVKARIREECKEHGIGHVTIEIERPGEECGEPECHASAAAHAGHAHHHHHH